jgi:ubiquitin-protein ligase E3 C
VRLFAGEDYSSICAFVNYRVKKLAYNCIRAVHHNRFALFILIQLLLLLLFVERY